MKIINQIRDNWAMGGARRWIIGILGVVLGCCVLSTCAGVLGGGSRPAATPTVAVAARATDAPKPVTAVAPTVDVQATVNAAVAATNAARPTNTPAPTNTPRPTNTPVPTATATAKLASGLSDVEQAYVKEMSSLMESGGGHISKIGELFTAAGKNSRLMQDNDWKIDVAVALVGVDTIGKKLVALHPPPRLAATHVHINRIGEQMSLVRENTVAAIDRGDATKFEAAAKNMRTIEAESALALNELNKLR